MTALLGGVVLIYLYRLDSPTPSHLAMLGASPRGILKFSLSRERIEVAIASWVVSIVVVILLHLIFGRKRFSQGGNFGYPVVEGFSQWWNFGYSVVEGFFHAVIPGLL